ncbi:MAG: NUDIX domain-containing protein, partial [Calditrichaeota bacterium]
VFKIIFSRILQPHEVEIHWDRGAFKIPPEMFKAIEDYWQRVVDEHIFNGELVRLDSWRLADGRLHLQLRPSDYQTLLYSNQHVDAICAQWGEAFLSRVLGISAIIKSQDDKLLLIKRSLRVGEYPGCFDVIGGHIDVPLDGAAPDVFQSMQREMEEETGLLPQECSLTLLGLVEAVPNRKPELVFFADCHLNMRQITERARQAKDRVEIEDVFLVNNSVSALDSILGENGISWSPSAFGCLYLYRDLLKHNALIN